MTLIRATTETRRTLLETAKDWPEVVDYVRQYFYGDLPAKDEIFDAIMKKRKEAERVAMR